MGTGKVVHLPRSNLAEGDYDPNLSKHFTAEQMSDLWRKIDRLVVEEVSKLVLKNEPHLTAELSPAELGLRVAQIAGFFLRVSARRVNTSAYAQWYKSRRPGA